MRYIITLIFLPLLACQTTRHSEWTLDAIFRDAPDEEKIYISYNNQTGRDICFPGLWPNVNGLVYGSDKDIYLVIEGKIYYHEYENPPYCPDGCEYKYDKDEMIEAFIKYEYFHIPDEDKYKEKTLNFKIHAHTC